MSNLPTQTITSDDPPNLLTDALSGAKNERHANPERTTETAEALPGNAPPRGVPVKFWDAERGEIRVEALLKSYLALEKRLSELTRRQATAPQKPEDYSINVPNGLFDVDPELNQRLHAAGFSNEQAQMIYDLAAERLIPLIREMAAELAAERELERLVERFGGSAKWRETARQILTWARRHLPPNVVDAMSTTEAGVMALYRMMSGSEQPGIMGRSPGAASTALPEGEDLDALIRDPRYWQEKDPAFVTRVTDAFRARYGES